MSGYSLYLSFFLATEFIQLSVHIFLLFVYRALLLQKSFTFSKFDTFSGIYYYFLSCCYMTSIIVSNLFDEARLYLFVQLFFHIGFNLYCFTLAKKVYRVVNIRIGVIYTLISVILSWSILREYLYFEFNEEEKNKENILYVILFGQQLYYSLSFYYMWLKYLEKKYERNMFILSFTRVNEIVEGDLDNNTCPICIESLKEKPVIKTNCKHLFHFECMESYIDTFLQNSQASQSYQVSKISCPMCRSVI